ncbi:MAG TPA: GNAT family N-acetyltransferase [Candidatus Obscuribacterales bacterium]
MNVTATGPMTPVPKMTSCPPQKTNTVIRSVQYRDLEAIEQLCAEASEAEQQSCLNALGRQIQRVRRWYGPLKFLSLFPNPCQYDFCVNVAEQDQQVRGMIQVMPFNRTRSTWRVERVLVDPNARPLGSKPATSEIGSQMLRHCFETILEASNWVLEVNINDQSVLALYRQNGFQPLAQLTYWAIAPELLQEIATHEPDLPNLLPVSNADAQLLYQLDTVAMPPLLRQVFDRQIHDFKTSIFSSFFTSVKQWLSRTNSVSGYVFEPQRKAAIGYFHLQLCRDGDQPHNAQLTVHPAYTWLYPELLAQMARIVKDFPSQSLLLASADYQPEREEYFERIGAERIEHSLLMSRSVWHKLRETKPMSLEGLQLSDVLQSLKPARQPVPSRIDFLQSQPLKSQTPPRPDVAQSVSTPSNSLSEESAPPPELPDANAK